MATVATRADILDYTLRTDIKKNALPFFFPAQDKKNLAILIHGFSGSPYDMAELGQYLGEQGISARGVLLAGHGGDYDHLAQAGHQEWWQSVKDELDRNEGQYENIYLIGYSFGSNLAIDLANRYPDKLKGIICMSASVFIRSDKKVRLLNTALSLFTDRVKKRRMRKERQSVYEAGGRHLVVPLKGLADFFHFIDNFTKREIGQVKTPILLIHARDDYASDPKSSEYIFEHIGSEDKELFMINEFEHNPLNTNSRNVIFAKILQFVAEHQQ
ncbi:MAG: alpha/beta fold hydrolase [Candidatus Komeilibacteria bacterium]